MENIIISAYACGPNRGSEPGMAWNWLINLCKYYRIHLITSCEFQEDLINQINVLGLDKNIIVYFNDIGDKATKMGQNQGDWRFYYYYHKWQKQTLKIANGINENYNIKLVHHLNMIGFREPGELYKLNKPFVWGPIGGLSFVPNAFIKDADFLIYIKYKLKNLITKVQIHYSTKIKTTVAKSSLIIGAVNDSKNKIEEAFPSIKVFVLNETGCHPIVTPIENNRFKSNEDFNVLWVGRDLFTKRLDIALQIACLTKRLPNIKFHFVGVEIAERKKYFNSELENLELEGKIIWHGKISLIKVNELMKTCQLFLFTSIIEGTPHVILESIQNQLPIICFDTCGQGECVNSEIGVKITPTTPENAVNEFAKEIEKMYFNRDILNLMSTNCINRSNELSWNTKTNKMIEYYKEAVLNFENKN